MLVSPLRSLIACAALVCLAPLARAARPSETLLPDTAKAYVSVAKAEQLKQSWKQTQLGKLLEDPSMKAFAEDLGDQLRAQWKGTMGDLGLSLDDLEAIAAGEIAGAVLHPKNQDPAVTMLIDVTDRLDKTDELLKRIDAEMKEKGAQRTEHKLHETKVTLYEKKEAPKDDPDGTPITRRAAFFIKDNILGVATRLEACDELLKRFSGEHRDSLDKSRLFQAVMNRCRSAAGDLDPQARWFIEPLALAKSIRALTNAAPPEGTDMLKVLENQGFSAIRSVGGFVNFAVGQYDLLHRTSAYAPKPYEKAARMLVFPNVVDLKPQPWVPADVATYVSVSCDLKNAFEMFGTMFDELFGEGEEGVFEDTLESIRTDPNGPGIDIRKDLIGHIGSRATLVIDYVQPITPNSERILFAAEATDEKKLAVTIQKSMQGDPTVVRRDFHGHAIWEIKEEELPEKPLVELPGDLPVADLPDAPGEEMEEEEEKERLLPSSAICVALGHIFVASHVDILERILQSAGQKSLAETPDYQAVSAELDKLGAKEHSVRMFRRTENEFRVNYELTRTGEMPEAKTLMAKLLNKAFNVQEGETRESKIDGSKLPDFESVRKYFGPAGLFSVSEEDGWLVTGFTLNREQP